MNLLDIIASVDGDWDKLPKIIKSDVAETDTDFCHHCSIAGVQTEATSQVDAVTTIYRRNSEGNYRAEEYWEDMKRRANDRERLADKAYYLYARTIARVSRGLCAEHTHVCETCGDPYSIMALGDNVWLDNGTNHHRDSFTHIYSAMAYTRLETLGFPPAYRWQNQVCPSCAEDTQECDACGALVNGNYESLHSVDGSDWCEDCINNSDARWCDYCDQYHTDYCESEDESDWGYGDATRNRIHDYSYKPDAIFKASESDVYDYHTSDFNWRSKVPFMGFELEVESNGDVTTGIDAIEATFGDDESYVYLKSDSSINYGFEIVSHPYTLAKHKEQPLAKALKMLSDLGFKSWRTTTCGLHVHVSRNGFSNPSHVWKFTHFIVDNKSAMVKLAGRESDRWASFNLESYSNGGIKGRAKGYTSYNRYEAINFQNARTLELRFFRGSLKVERVLSALELTEGAVEYTRNLTTKDVINGALDFSSFVTWLRERSEKYPNLLSYVDSLGIAEYQTAKATAKASEQEVHIY